MFRPASDSRFLFIFLIPDPWALYSLLQVCQPRIWDQFWLLHWICKHFISTTRSWSESFPIYTVVQPYNRTVEAVIIKAHTSGAKYYLILSYNQSQELFSYLCFILMIKYYWFGFFKADCLSLVAFRNFQHFFQNPDFVVSAVVLV